MKLKLDENFDVRILPLLVGAGHDVTTVPAQNLSGTSDGRLFQVVVAEQRALLTLDLDFANPLRFPTRGTAGVLVVRTPRPLLSLIESALRAALPHVREDRVHGKLWIIEPTRIREYSPVGEGE